MPAAAVIPAPIAYTNVVAVKKLVVGFQFESDGHYMIRLILTSLTETFMLLI